MRINTVLFLSLLFLCIGLDGQAQYKKRYNRSGSTTEYLFGVKAGYQLSNFTGDQFLSEINSDNIAISPEVEYQSLGSYHLGGYMEMRFSVYFAIQPELYYGVFGSKMLRRADPNNPENNFMVTPVSVTADIEDVILAQRLTTLTLPIVGKALLTKGLELNFGPLISSKRKEEQRYGSISDTLVTLFEFTDSNAPDLYKNLNFGGLLGLSYQLENGFNASLRYSRILNNINKNERLKILAKEPKNGISTFLFSIGYTFNYVEGRNKVKLSN